MIRTEILADRGIVIVHPESKLTSEDFEGLTRQVDPLIEERGGLAGLMIEAASFPGWEDFTGFASHVRFVKDHHKKIEKVAIVVDGNIVAMMPKIANHFVAAEIRHFECAQREDALAWLARSLSE